MKRPLFVVSTILIVVLFFWIYLPVLSRYRQLRTEQERMETEIAELEKRIHKLSEEKSLLQNDVQYIERIIREEMGLVKPGEVIYKFVEEKSAPVQ